MRLFRAGDSGEEVRDIQDRLTALGYACSPDSPGGFGGATRSAIIAFQTAKGLVPDGVVGPDTWRALVAARYRLGQRLLYNRRPMLRGDDVAELQQRLNALGFDAGKVDGIFGPDTMAGVLGFQQNRGMPEDGIAGPELAAELQLMDRATRKPGRDQVRDHQWILALPRTPAGLRIYLDPACRSADEGFLAWEAAQAAAAGFQELGALPLFSRAEDAAPPVRNRAMRANRLGVDCVVGFALPESETSCVKFFASEHSHSPAGQILAGVAARRLEVPAVGATVPLVKDTRSPAILVAHDRLSRASGDAVVSAFVDLLTAEDRTALAETFVAAE